MAIEPEKWHYPQYVTSLAKDLISKLLEVDPCKRISIKQALEHPFLRESDIKGSYQSNLSSFLVD